MINMGRIGNHPCSLYTDKHIIQLPPLERTCPPPFGNFPKLGYVGSIECGWPQVDTIHSEPPTMGFAAGMAVSGGLAGIGCLALEMAEWI